MAFPIANFIYSAALAGSGAALAAPAVSRWAKRRQARECARELDAAREAGTHLCFSTLEALTYALEASDPYNIGHLDSVQRSVAGLCEAFGLPAAETAALRAAALLHNIGRLGVPASILNKAEALLPEEQEKLRVHPALGARILASVPFPWNVVELIRSHSEHWDGGGYPAGIKRDAIPLGARILAVANAFSALQRPRPYRAPLSATEALIEIERQAGTQFDPGVVAAFRPIAAQFRAESEQRNPLRLDSVDAPDERNPRAWLDDIAAAQREALGLARLAEAVSGSLHLQSVSQTLLESVREIVACDACALFLPDDDEDILRGVAALGANERHLIGSMARIGTYLTGRAFSQKQPNVASFLPDDLRLREVSDAWTPLRSTLIVPLLQQDGRALGTLNLYAAAPDAFGAETLRVMRVVATQAARAVDNARRFHEIHESAYTDSLTGLRNARYLREFLERETNRAQRDGSSFAVLTIDLDNFKPINDRFGHGRGDQVLRDCGEILSAHVRSYDLAARYAGDEFVVALSRTDALQADIVATKLKIAVEKYGQKLIAREPDFPQVGISIGVAMYPEDGADLPALLCRSDAAMYADKKGRGGGRKTEDRAAA